MSDLLFGYIEPRTWCGRLVANIHTDYAVGVRDINGSVYGSGSVTAALYAPLQALHEGACTRVLLALHGRTAQTAQRMVYRAATQFGVSITTRIFDAADLPGGYFICVKRKGDSNE